MTHDKYSGRTLDGKYRVLDLLGEGGMGSVYRGEHLLIGRQVAIKFLSESLLGNEEAVKRFYQEGQAAASIRHRNVIDILDMGVSPQGEPYLVMEYLEGEGLADLMARVGPLDLADAAGLLEQILAALGAAHDRGIVHRDLKPDNVFLERQRGGAPGIKLIDFGISKLAAAEGTALTRDGSMLGTPAYMSPEQVRSSKDVDRRTDLYAAGAILYEMLAGSPPYDGEHYSEILSAVLTVPPRDPRELRADFPDAARPFIERAMARDPAGRFATADEMLMALEELVPVGERAARLTLLGASMPAVACAVGDLGPVQESGDTMLAAEVLGRMVEERTGARPWKRLARRAGKAVEAARGLARRAGKAVEAARGLARRVAAEPRLRLRAAVGAGTLLLVLVLVALCSGGETESPPEAPSLEASGADPGGETIPEARPGAEREPPPAKVEAGRLGEPGTIGASPPATEQETDKKPGSKPSGKKKRKTPRLPWQK